MDCPHDDQQTAIVSALTEGCSIRPTERLTGIHRDTIMRLGVRVGKGSAVLHDAMMRGLHVGTPDWMRREVSSARNSAI